MDAGHIALSVSLILSIILTMYWINKYEKTKKINNDQ